MKKTRYILGNMHAFYATERPLNESIESRQTLKARLANPNLPQRQRINLNRLAGFAWSAA